MSTRLFFFAAATSLVLVIFLAATALGQGTYQAQIRGVVSDPTGAVVGNATVTITENGTNLSTTAKTGADGYYILRGLRPSTYSVKAFRLWKSGMSSSRSISRLPSISPSSQRV